MGFPSFAESRNLDSNRSAFADHKSTTGAAHRKIRPPRKTSNQFAVTITHRSRYAYTEDQLKQAQIQHESIFNAINNGDYALAKWLMAEHVNKSSDLAIQHLSSSL
jgi:hypothetical protein